MASTENVSRSRAYRDRASECRMIAENLHTSETRRQLLEVAEQYERMAMQVEGLELQQAELEQLDSVGDKPRNTK